jgi:hypothetical protein
VLRNIEINAGDPEVIGEVSKLRNMARRIKAIKEGNKGYEKYCKMMLNSSYGYDIKNEKNYSKTKLCNKKQELTTQGKSSFLHPRQISDDLYLATYKASTYKCDTCIQCGFYTLDNAKFAYLMFYYGFCNKCLDMERLHFVEGDTDSMYLAVAGDPNAGIHQGFEYIVKNEEFYRQHVYEWFPNPKLGKEDEKKLGGVAVENEGHIMIAIAPKNYTIIKPGKPNQLGDVEDEAKLKNKGVSLKRNQHITTDSYFDNIQFGTVTKGENKGFGIKNDIMTKYSVDKVAISGIHTKRIVLSNQSCAPYVYGLKAKDYSVEE